MSNNQGPQGLPPLTLPEGKRTEGTLLVEKVVKRIKPKSDYLRKLERLQKKGRGTRKVEKPAKVVQLAKAR